MTEPTGTFCIVRGSHKNVYWESSVITKGHLTVENVMTPKQKTDREGNCDVQPICLLFCLLIFFFPASLWRPVLRGGGVQPQHTNDQKNSRSVLCTRRWFFRAFVTPICFAHGKARHDHPNIVSSIPAFRVAVAGANAPNVKENEPAEDFQENLALI